MSFHTHEQAEAAFYAAFEKGDLEAMMSVWSDDPDIVCIHPHGPSLVGQQEIRDGWRQIMTHSPRMRFDTSELNTVCNDDIAVRFVNEKIHVGDADEPDFTILATNVYRRSSNGWRIILHHASPTPESLQNITQEELSEGPEETDDVTIH